MHFQSRLQPGSRRALYLWAAGLVMGLSFWLRAANLYGIPIFSFLDEGDHVLWAQRFAVGNSVYPFLMDGKFLLGVVLSMFRLNGPGALWLARGAIGLFATVSCAASIAGAARLHSRRAGLLAGVVYAILPQAVLFEKQVFADPLMSAFGLAAAALTFRLVARPGPLVVAATSVLLALAALTKLNGLTYLAFPALAGILLVPRTAHRPRVAAAAGAVILLAVLLMAATLLMLAGRLGQNDGNLAAGRIGFIGCPASICKGSPAQQLHNLSEYAGNQAEALQTYIGWPAVALAGLAVPMLRFRRRAVYFSLATLLMWAAFAFTAQGYVPARYMSFIAGPFAIFAAVGAMALADRLAAARPRLKPVAAPLAIAILCAQPAANTAVIVGNFSAVQLASQDYPGYFAPGLGPGISAAALALQPLARQNPPPVILVSGVPEHLVGAYFDRTRVDVRGLSEARAVDVGRWLFENQAALIIAPASTLPEALTVQPYGSYPIGEPTVAVWRVTEIDPASRAEVFEAVFVAPEKLEAEHEALIGSLSAAGATSVLVYPPHHAATLAGLTAATQPEMQVTAIGDSWPLDVPAVEAELQALAETHASLQVVLVEETKGDPQRRIETWLKTHLFVINEQWFGPVRMLEFVGGGSPSETTTVGGRFGDSVTLQSVDLWDTAPPPGGLVRVRLVWQVEAALRRPHKVFVHIFAGERIIAQHDGQPVGELRPTDTWQAGETVIDQFAIRLPADAPPGSYRLRIGLYDLETQARLPVTLPGAATDEFWTGAEIEVQ